MWVYLTALRLPLIAVVLNFFLMPLICAVIDEETATTFSLSVRGCAALCGGWLVISRGAGALGRAALAGGVLLLVDHVMLKGGLFLVAALAPQADVRSQLLAFAGVLVSYAMFAPVALLLSWTGGVVARMAGHGGAPIVRSRERGASVGIAALSWAEGIVASLAMLQLLRLAIEIVAGSVASGAVDNALWTHSLASVVLGLVSGAVTIAAAAMLRRYHSWARLWLMWSGLEALLGLLVLPHARSALLAAWSPVPAAPAIFSSIRAVAPYLVALWALVYLLPRDVAFPSPRGSTRTWPPLLAGSVLLGCYLLAPPRQVSPAEEHARIQALPVQPGIASVRFRLFYNGRPLRDVPDSPAHVSLFDLKGQRPITQSARMVNGVIEVPAVPTGIYRAYVIVQTASGDVPGEPGLGLPGDYVGDMNEVTLDRAGASPVLDLPVGRFMHLLQPEDTAAGVAWRTETFSLTTPVRFSWEAVPGARRYDVFIQQFFRSTGAWDVIAMSSTPAPEWTASFPAGASGESYRFGVHAIGDDVVVGQFKFLFFTVDAISSPENQAGRASRPHGTLCAVEGCSG